MITFKQTGNFSKTDKFFTGALTADYLHSLNKYGQEGVTALSMATPIDSGNTASKWSYSVTNIKGYASISWYNSNVNNGVPIVILLEYGHATKNGGYVQGRDFINITLRPIFDKIAESVWKEIRAL